MIEIELKFDKLITNLAGNRFGRETFTQQVRDNMDYNQSNNIILPNRIEDIASSFIQGFYSEVSEKFGKEKALQLLDLKADNKNVVDKINKSIETYGI